MFKTLKKLFDNEYKELYRFSKLADQIDALDEEMSKLSDKKLASYTDKFKKRLEEGETLDDILVEAFAVAREAAYRCLGMKPFYCQLLGGLAIHYGNIAEMKTGEGKTLTCVLPAYLNALTGKGVHIVTVNEFLSTRDSEWMGSIFKFLGLTVGLNLRELSFKEKQEAYNCDILYSTNNELGFDYLRDNMVIKKENRVQRPLNYCIVDEVDSILIDEARTPLIISGGVMQSANLYIDADRYVKSLKETSKGIIESAPYHEALIPQYDEVLNEAPENSVIYIDPPYYESFGMYYGEFDFNEFNTNINKYADKYRKVIISFDNKPVDEIDFSLYNRHKIYSGKSGFKKLHKEDTEVFESLYVSKK